MLSGIRTGLWRTGTELFGHMRQKSTGLVKWKDVCVKKSRQAFIEQGIVKFRGGFLMVWECMGQNGVGIFVEMEGCMDAEQYVSILEDKLLPSMKNSGLSKKSIIFQ